MTDLLRCHRLLATFPVFLLLLAGCGGPPAPRAISGKVVFGPKTKLAETDNVSVIFVEEGAGGKSVTANVAPKDLTFTGKVPPGKYKVSVSVQPYPGEKDSEKRTAEFKEFNRTYSATTSPLTFEVGQEQTQSITVDLTKNSVTKG